MAKTKSTMAMTGAQSAGLTSEAPKLSGLMRTGSTLMAASAATLMVASSQVTASAANISPVVELSAGGVYEQAPISSLYSIPLSLRNVPINPADSGSPGPISQTSLKPSALVDFATFKLGAKVETDSKKYSFSAGVGFDVVVSIDSLSNPDLNADTAERNYTDAPGTSQRGGGAALTFEQVRYHYLGGDWNSYLRPFAFAEVTHPLSDKLTVSLGVKVTQQSLDIATGWDRFDTQSDMNVTGAATYYTAMPYVQLRCEPDRTDPDVKLHAFYSLVVGLDEPIFQNTSAGMQLSRNTFPFFVGGNLGWRF